MIYLEDGSVVPVDKSELPVLLPEDIDLNSQGNPLDNHLDWKNTTHKKSVKKQLRDRYSRYICKFLLVFFKSLSTA